MLNYIPREDTLSFQDNMMEVFKMLSTISKK
jgi:hypothetical protein